MALIKIENMSVEFPLLGMKVRKSSDSSQVTGGHGELHKLSALRNVSLSLQSGDVLGLIGRNGSGKSTLLKTMGGIYFPTSGSIIVDGNISPMYNIGLGMRPESTGRRNIELRGLVLGRSMREIRAKTDSIIEFSDLHEHIDLPIRIYSQGMTMRLAFSIATAFEPEILLLDEWIGAGDAAFRQKASARLDSLVRNSAITVLASHNVQLLRQTCNKVLWLQNGVVKMIGETEEILKQYVQSVSKK